jgi:hypothetical protein
MVSAKPPRPLRSRGDPCDNPYSFLTGNRFRFIVVELGLLSWLPVSKLPSKKLSSSCHSENSLSFYFILFNSFEVNLKILPLLSWVAWLGLLILCLFSRDELLLPSRAKDLAAMKLIRLPFAWNKLISWPCLGEMEVFILRRDDDLLDSR